MTEVKRRSRIWFALALAILAACALVAVRRHHRAIVHAASAEKKRKKKESRPYERPAQPVIVRSGLPNLRRKLDARQPVTVAFIGGSITYNAGDGGFVSRIPEWLVARTPGSRVEIINAGVPATGSDFGAQRVDRDVLVHRPDVVFIEFAVNDAARECLADMERLVRKIRMAENAPEIVMLYSMSIDTLPLLDSGKFPRSVNSHEAVAAHYNLPSVALGYEAARKIRAGEWEWADFSKDACHPTPKGYGSYNHDIDSALAALLGADTVGADPLPGLLTPGLVVYPPLTIASPQPAPKPMLDDLGAPAKETDELPLFGTQWIGSAEFPEGKDARWRLRFRPIDKSAAVDAANGLERREWKPQRWFDETRSFTGRTSHALVQSPGDAGNLFGSSPFDEPVLTWQAPTAGTCIIALSASGVEGAATSPDARAAINIVQFAPGAAQGESIGFQITRPGEALALRKSVRVTAGDTLAFVFHPAGYKYAAYKGFRVAVGNFGPEERPNSESMIREQ